MTKLSHIIFITLVTLGLVTGQNQHRDSKYALKNKKLKETFNKLLHEVTSLNQERLNSLNKYNELQNYRPKVGRNGDKIIAVIFPNTVNLDRTRDDVKNAYKRDPGIRPGGISGPMKTFKDTHKNKKIYDEYLKMIGSEEKSNYLRQWKGCSKSAAKSCNKACKKAFKSVCSDYKCSKSMKKASKRSCKRICNSEFGRDDYD